MERVDLQEFVGGFIAESDQLVASATAVLLEIEQANARGESQPKAVRDLFRALHTLKGLAGMMGIQPIVDIAHALETVVRVGDQAGGRLGGRSVELGLIAVRAIADRVRAVADRRTVTPPPAALLDELGRVDAVGGAAPGPATIVAEWHAKLAVGEREQVSTALRAGRSAYTITFAPSDDKASRGVTIASVRTAVARLGDLVKVVPRGVPTSADAPAGLCFDLLAISDATREQLAEAAATTVDHVTPIVAEEPAPERAELPTIPDAEPAHIGRAFVRVELARLDELQDQLSALIVSRYALEREIAALAANGVDVRRLRDIAEIQARRLRDLRRAILRARMVRVAEVLEPLPLLVRSLTRPGVKEARLEVDTRDAELDKAVADRLLPMIVHLVRNAVDHAIEPVAERTELGKPPAGTVRITSRDTGNQLELEVRDDGRGIDRAKVARRAGRAIEDTATLLEVLTTPGFSTRDVATQTSGRGLGLDIVRRVTTSELGGELSLWTELGRGTAFTLRVPLTIAIIDVFSFECGRQSFVVPVAAIEEIFEIADQTVTSGPAPGRDPLAITLCERRGRAMPLVALAGLLRVDAAAATKALVVRHNGEPIAFGVDRMLGRHEVVVRPIDDALGRAPGVAGATDLGDGRPTLLLDLVELGSRIKASRPERLS